MERQVQSPAQVMRIVKYCFIASGFLYFYVVTRVMAQAQQPANPPTQLAISLVGIASVVAGFLLPRIIFRADEGAAQTAPVEALRQRWFAKGIMSLALFEACILFGLVQHFLGAPMWRVELHFGVGIVAMLIWSPGIPPGAQGGEFPRG